MSKGRISSGVMGGAVLLLLWGIAFSMAAQLTLHPLNVLSNDVSFSERLLGASRVALGDSFFDQADTYFHKGVEHVHTKSFSNSYFQTLGAAIKPSTHVHPEGVEVSEIMPWLRFATKMDPNNVDVYLTTAYWLDSSIGRSDVAELVLQEAQRNNPRDYRVINARAKLLFGTGADSQAAQLLDAAIKLWPSHEDPKDPQARLDLAQMLSYRAFLYEIQGDRTGALDLFKRAYEIMPNNKAMESRIVALERGEDFSRGDRQRWESIFARHHVCAREGEDHDEDPGHESDE